MSVLALALACTDPEKEPVETGSPVDTAAPIDTADLAREEALACLGNFQYNYLDDENGAGLKILNDPGDPCEMSRPLEVSFEGDEVTATMFTHGVPSPEDIDVYVQSLSEDEDGTRVYTFVEKVTPSSVEGGYGYEDFGAWTFSEEVSVVTVKFTVEDDGNRWRVLTTTDADCTGMYRHMTVGDQECARGIDDANDSSLYVDTREEAYGMYDRIPDGWRLQ